MKTLLSLLLLAATPALAQTVPAAGTQAAGAPAAHPAVLRPLPDSVRQAVHQLFKRGRLFSAVGGVSGALVASSGLVYGVRDGWGWSPAVDVALGGGAVAAGIVGKAHYSRRQERRVLSALAQGDALPPYVAEMVPLLPKRNRQLVLGKL